jgi:hypothetical protein
MTVEFKFKVDQKVKSERFGKVGYITICGVDITGKCYYVKTADGGDWHSEAHLTAIEE